MAKSVTKTAGIVTTLALVGATASWCASSVQAPEAGSGPVLVGRVAEVFDGDTFRAELASGPIRVRLHAIDAPERDQPHGRDAYAALYSRIANRDVEIEVVEQDQYDRQVAVVLVDGTNVNAEMVRQGHAWAYRAFMTDPGFCHLEGEARAQRLGFWALSAAEQVAPWEWRNLARGERFVPTDYSSSSAADCINATGMASAVDMPTRAPARQPGCDIKGNISDSGRIYHVPGSPDYDRTRINETRGERWFCTAGEAEAAGWRAPQLPRP